LSKGCSACDSELLLQLLILSSRQVVRRHRIQSLYAVVLSEDGFVDARSDYSEGADLRSLGLLALHYRGMREIKVLYLLSKVPHLRLFKFLLLLLSLLVWSWLECAGFGERVGHVYSALVDANGLTVLNCGYI